MATVKLAKKEPAGPLGNYNYTYECTCSNASKKTVVVTSANDTEADMLAQQECEDQCGEL